MKTLAMIAQKGGTGKTTLAIHLAVQADLCGLRVLLVDTDPQASATSWRRRRLKKQPASIQATGKTLSDLLHGTGKDRYDLVIVDTAPHSSEDARACIALADHICIPTRPAILDLDAIGPSTDLASQAGARASIVLNGCPPPTQLGEARIVSEAREALAEYKTPISDVAISQRVAFSHALIDGQAACEYDPGGKAAAEIDLLWNSLRIGTGQ